MIVDIVTLAVELNTEGLDEGQVRTAGDRVVAIVKQTYWQKVLREAVESKLKGEADVELRNRLTYTTETG